jgi:hypothetical protein
MFPKIVKRAKVSALLGLLCLLLLVGAIYLHYQHTAAPVQERIYGVPERSERQAVQPATAFQQPPVHSTAHTHVAEAPHHGDIDSAHDHESDTSAPADAPDLFLLETSFPEEPLPTESAHDAEEARLAELALQIENLVAAHNEKYPELVQLVTVTPAEFDELYPTPEDRKELAELAEKARVAYLSEFSSLFSQFPADMREKALAEAHDHFTTYMGQGMADAIVTEVRSLLGQ